MRIKNLQITNFRNLQKVDLELKNINILTGKNASGKTNFLHALAHSLETKPQLGLELNNNVTTKGGRGKSSTRISVKLDKISGVCIVEGRQQVPDSIGPVVYLPSTVEYANTISSSDYNSLKQEFIYTGHIEDGDWEKVMPRLEAIQSSEYKVREIINFPGQIRDVTNASTPNVIPGTVTITTGVSRFEANKILDDDFGGYFFADYKKNPLHKFIKKLENGVYINEMSSHAISDYVLSIPTGELYEQIIKRLKQDRPSFRVDFSNSSFAMLLADIQSNKEVSEKFYNDLDNYTNGLIKKVYIQTSSSSSVGGNEKIGNDGMILVDTPNAPKWISSISAGSAVMIFFIALKNWLTLPRIGQSYEVPSIILFDEIDSSLHPTLIAGFIEVLRFISERIQIISSSHSPFFLDQFQRDEIYYIKPRETIGHVRHNRSDVLSYEQIIKKVGPIEAKEFDNYSNSKLFIEGLIDALYPSK